jgi:anti-sigma B factor antagonist
MTVAELEIAGGRARLALRGEIDVASVAEVSAAVAHAREQHVSTMEVDLSLVDFIDSSGLGVIAEAAADLAGLRIVAAPISVIRVIELTGLGGLLALDGGSDPA